MITWPAGLLAVEMDLISYPITLFPSANQYNQSSFFFEFFLFPTIAIIFSLHYPKKRVGIVFYYIIFTGFFTGLEVILEKTTKLVEYHHWKWYWTFVTVNFSLFINHTYYLWFIKGLKGTVISG